MISILKHRVVPAALMSLMVIFLSSCGYHMGSMMHPQIKTVAIAEVRNETREVLAGTIMRKQLAERFQFDNSLKITTPEKADCIVMYRIKRILTFCGGLTAEPFSRGKIGEVYRHTAFFNGHFGKARHYYHAGGIVNVYGSIGFGLESVYKRTQ